MFGVTIILNIKVRVIKIKHYQGYLNKIRPYLENINDLKKSDT